MSKTPFALITVSAVALTAGAVGATAFAQPAAPGAAPFEPKPIAMPIDFGGGYGKRHGRHGHGHGPRGGMMRDLARQADTNDDMALTQEEIDAFIQTKVDLGDADGDGSLTLDEFQTVYVDLMRRMIVDHFQRLDEDGDGQITPAEIDERFGSIVVFMDRNDDGKLDRADMRPGRHGWRRHRGDRHHGERRGGRGHDRGPGDDGPGGPGGGDDSE